MAYGNKNSSIKQIDYCLALDNIAQNSQKPRLSQHTIFVQANGGRWGLETLTFCSDEVEFLTMIHWLISNENVETALGKINQKLLSKFS